ncbi:MAG: radical SAM protein [Deltaproteobacteria bacterium]
MESKEVLRVTETFLSIQGEGDDIGWPCFFIRLAGCNLRCTYCDTRYAYQGGEERSVADLIEEWRKAQVSRVLVTGGEPLLQEGSINLMEALLAEGARVILETNGSLSLEGVPSGVVKVLDRKTPGSGMSERWNALNVGNLTKGDQVKFVLVSREDYEWAREEVLYTGLHRRAQVLFSPVISMLSPMILAHWILDDRLPVRFQVQLHKIIWGERQEGIRGHCLC